MNIKALVALIALLLALVGGVVSAIDYFAKSADLKLVEYRLDQKIRNDRIYEIQQQLWQLEDRYEGTDCSSWPQADKDRYRDLKLKLEFLKGET